MRAGVPDEGVEERRHGRGGSELVCAPRRAARIRGRWPVRLDDGGWTGLVGLGVALRRLAGRLHVRTDPRIEEIW